jgi:hypothetical protein
LLTLLMKLNARVGDPLRGIKTAVRRRGEREDENGAVNPSGLLLFGAFEKGHE